MKRMLIILLLISFPCYADFYGFMEGVLIIGSVADYTSTVYILQKYPNEIEESNPLMKIATKNSFVLAGIKMGGTYISIKAMRKIKEYNKTLATIIICALAIGTNYVVYRNIKLGLSFKI